MKQEIQTLFEQKMTRKEFLQYVGSAFLFAVGVGSLLKAFRPASKSNSLGYGTSLYGGAKQSN